MEWSDEAIVIGSRRHGESAAVVTVLSKSHGRHAGLVRGGSGKRARAALQPGNRVQVSWKARLAEQLGNFTWELTASDGTRWLHSRGKLAAVTSACALIEATLPERESHPAAFAQMMALLADLAREDWRAAYVRWEVALLAEIGYGLDLTSCAATGSNDNLAFVSPRTGRAVSASAGEPYRDKLLALPPFLGAGGPLDPDQIRAGLMLTGHFLERWVFATLGKRMPAARTRLVAAI